MGIGLVVEASRPEDAPERLAIQLAEALGAAQKFDQQAVEFSGAAQRERGKAVELRKVHAHLTSGELIEYKGRMDPMRTYEPEAILTEAEQADQRAQEFDSKAAMFRRKLVQERREAETLQTRLRAVANGKR